jgi:hypothetical protein
VFRGGFDNCGDDFEKEGFRAVEINHNENKMMSIDKPLAWQLYNVLILFQS